MDGSLSASRYDDQDRNQGGSHYQSRNDGRHYNRRGRGGGYRDNRRGGGSGRDGYRDDRRYQPYHRRGGGGGGGGRGRSSPANRFDNSTVTQSVDPQTAMMKQLTAMIAKMGDLIPAAETAAPLNDESSINGDGGNVRPVTKAIAKNIQDLVGVLCNTQNAPLFLKYQTPIDNASSVIAEDEAGPMATLVTSCAATLPLSSPSYAGLTLAVEINAPDSSPDTANVSYRGFAQRCVTMACRRFMEDLDKTCGVVHLVSQDVVATNGDDGKSSKGDTYVQAFMRCKLLLRYFALLTRAGIIAKDYDSDFSMDSFSDLSTLSLTGLLNVLVESASRAQEASLDNSSGVASNLSLKNISVILAMLALSAIPYALQCLSQDFVNEILSKLKGLTNEYKSHFQPGTGMMAILMKKEFKDDFNPDKDEDDDENDDEDDEDDSSPVCADSFQDLLRTVKKLAESFYESATISTRYALLTDEPWVGLLHNQEEYAPMEGDMEGEDSNQHNNSSAPVYNGEKLHFSITEECHCLKYFMNRDASNEMETVAVTLQRPSIEGVVFGRLSIFDPPPEDEDEDDVTDPNTAAYINTYSLIDRFFLSDAIRDCLICHRCTVTKAGVTQGSVKDVAIQIWSVSELFTQSSESGKSANDASMGFECGVVETILALLAQAPKGIESSNTMTHVYLSRVLIELIKYQPSKIPQSLAIAVSDIFNDFIPSLSPISKENLSYWFAFHLVNTDYQWPSAHWNAWAPYVVQGMENRQRNSRGEYVMKVIEFMTSFESNPEVLVNVCLPPGNKLSSMIISERESADTIKSSAFQTTIDNIENDLVNRIWKNNDDSDDIHDYIIGEETTETVNGSIDDDLESSTSDDSKIFWRTGLIVRSLLDPTSCYRLRMISRIEKSVQQQDEDSQGLHFTDDEFIENPKEDIITDMIDLVDRYKSVILSCLAKDIQVFEENLDLRGETKVSSEDMLHMGESFILCQCEKICAFSYSIFSACVECFIRNKIISPKGVLMWCLGSNTTKRGAGSIGRSWWNIASFAVCLGVDNLLSESHSKLTADIGMIIDTVGDDESDENMGTASARQIKKVNDFLVPLLQFASSQVNSSNQSNSTVTQKSINHSEADMKEGLKFLLRSTLNHAALSLRNDEIVKTSADLGGSPQEVDNWIAKITASDVDIIH
jgi:hypothetical protein